MAMQLRLISTCAFILVMLMGGQNLIKVKADPAPTCKSFGSSWYFPNACVSDCKQISSTSTMDVERSRNVGGNLKCYCTGQEQPLCTDEPRCSDLEISPGSVLESCQTVCGSETVAVTDDVEFAGDASAASKNQTHFRVSCSCSDGTEQCGTDYILFSDLTYLPSCTGRGENSLQIKSAEACDAHCTSTNVFVGGSWNSGDKACMCLDGQSKEAIACDDSRANFNDGSGLGNPCYENVGLSTVDCSSSNSIRKAALLSTASILGLSLLLL